MPESTNINAAERFSTVGIQAGVVHDSNVYISGLGSPPEERFQKAVNYLNSGVAYPARELLEEVLAESYDRVEVRFYWLLSVLSKKSYREIDSHDHAQISDMREVLESYPKSVWKDGVRSIYGILDSCRNSKGANPSLELKRLRDLPWRQYGAIAKHLEHILTGPVKEAVWGDIIESANSARYSRGRMERIWSYFAPEPIPPRVRVPVPIDSSIGGSVFWCLLFAAAISGIGWSTIMHSAWLNIVNVGLMLTGAFIGLRNAFEWWARSRLLRLKENELIEGSDPSYTRSDGFAASVSNRFEYYFRKYSPIDPEAWLQETSGIRKRLRDELVELYRESRIGEARIRWLIRFLAIDVRDRWQDGTLWEFRNRYRTPISVKVWCCIGISVATGGAVTVIESTLSYGLDAGLLVLGAAVSGYFAVKSWFGNSLAKRRYREEVVENRRELEKRVREYWRWKQKLERIRPTEDEMEAWLASDKALLLDEVLRAHRMSWRDITVSAFLQTPAENCNRAKVRGGPWRYSRYNVRIFLVTVDGVREIATTLEFRRSLFGEQNRHNYRFDTVSSVRVETKENIADAVELTLVDGSTKKLQLGDVSDESFDLSEDLEKSTLMTLETSGFGHVVRVLEGIAAEGKEWIQRGAPTV
ncbi:hypothetical protein ABT332_03500 [Saccharomonospora azurea]|uniref:hypothetical protein n=1 Tax=Saccharomonospora azurea TaxID=40988 RepID=UPI00332B3E9A